jgi:uncharacterized protein YgiM (DUF1202 family)
MDEQALHDAVPAIQEDDALVVIWLPREKENYAARPMKYYQVNRASIWQGVGGATALPDAIPVEPEPPAPPQPPLPPVATQVTPKNDYINVRGSAGASYAVLTTIKHGAIFGINLKSGKVANGWTWVQVLSSVQKEAVGGWVAYELLTSPQ